jgi:hypothetical protein
MILNSFAVLMAFVASIRLLLGLTILVLGALAWLAPAPSISDPEDGFALEDRSYLVFLLTLLLVALNLASWPLLYLLLQSYVPEWPEVMCIYGVTQIGKDSLGPAAWLPGLLVGMQWTKPALVFLGGGWFVLYLLNRKTRTAALLGRLFCVLLPLGALAITDAATELTYLAIPKKEEFPTSGCCTSVVEAEGVDASTGWREAVRPWVWMGYYGGNFVLILALAFLIRSRATLPGSAAMTLLLALGAGVLAASSLFLIDIASPALLQLPYHRCPYDLIPLAPEAVVAVAFFLSGCFFLGWAGVARWLGRIPETEAFLGDAVGRLLQSSLCGFLASLVMLSLELWLS